MAASSKPKSRKTLMKENQCDAETPMVIKNYLRKTFADIMADEMEEKIITALCGVRTQQKVDVAERLLRLLVDMTGENCTLQSPRTGTQRILVFAADQLAVWLIDTVDSADSAVAARMEKKLKGIEEGGKGDANNEKEVEDDEDGDVQIIHKKKRPSKTMSSSQRGSGDAGDKSGRKADQKKPGKKKDEEKAGAESLRGQSSRGTSKKRAASKSEGKGQSNRVASDSGVGDKKGGGGAKGAGGAGGGGGPDGKSTSRPSQVASKTSQGGSKKSTRPSAEASKTSTGKGGAKPPTRSASQSQSQLKAKTSGTARVSTQGATPSGTSDAARGGGGPGGPGGVASRPLSRQSSSTQRLNRPSESRRPSKGVEQRPRTASEAKRDKVKDLIGSNLSAMIAESSKRQTPRAEALQDIISKKLESTVIPLDQQAIDAIRDASVLIAAYIDKQAENVELEYGVAPPPNPLAQRGKGPVFSVKGVKSSYDIQRIAHTEAKAKIEAARGRPAPGTITLTKGSFNSKETKDWANWANDVVTMASKWSQWIDSTVSKAITAAEKKKAGGEVPQWKEWRATTGDEALEWRRNKKQLVKSANLFLEKIDATTKPKNAPLSSTEAAAKTT